MQPSLTRVHILAAAHQVIRERGLAGATTKEIARRAGYSEGSIYNHFQDKLDLVSCVIAENLPDLWVTVQELTQKVGQATVQANLERVAEVAQIFFYEMIPLSSAVFADPELRRRYRDQVAKTGGPINDYQAISAYIQAEQTLGRLTSELDAATMTLALLGSCHEYASLAHVLTPEQMPVPPEKFAQRVVAALLSKT